MNSLFHKQLLDWTPAHFTRFSRLKSSLSALETTSLANTWPGGWKPRGNHHLSQETNGFDTSCEGAFLDVRQDELSRIRRAQLWRHMVPWQLPRARQRGHQKSLAGWWLTYPSEKWWSECQLGWWHSQYGKKAMFQTTNQLGIHSVFSSFFWKVRKITDIFQVKNVHLQNWGVKQANWINIRRFEGHWEFWRS